MKSLEPYDSGRKILVEHCQKISITSYIKQAKSKLKNTLITADLEMDNKIIGLMPSKTAFGGIRYWFKCPVCEMRIGVLFIHPLNRKVGCKKCLNLDYRSRRYKGMIENSVVAKQTSNLP